MAPLALQDPVFLSKATLASQDFKVYLDPRDHQGPMDKKDNQVLDHVPEMILFHMTCAASLRFYRLHLSSQV